MPEWLDAPALRLYFICSSVLALHMVALALWTGTVRTLRKTYVNPEDSRAFKGQQADADHPDVVRTKKAHLNAIENAVPFFVVGALYALTGPSRLGAEAYFFTFTGARLLHSVFYLWGKQPFRTAMFTIGVLAIVGMAVHVLRVAL